MDPAGLSLHQDPVAADGSDVDHHVGERIDVAAHGIVPQDDPTVTRHAAGRDEGGTEHLRLPHDIDIPGQALFGYRPPILVQFDPCIVGDKVIKGRWKSRRRHPLSDPLEFLTILAVDPAVQKTLRIGDQPCPVHAA